jgi:ferredoxin
MAAQTEKIEVFHERCMGAGNCAEVAEKYFDQSDTDGTVVVRRTEIDPEDLDLVKKAMDVCPVGALALAKHVE